MFLTKGFVLLVKLFFQIFHTPEGMLSSEQGVYVAESVASKNTRQAKGRFRMYEDDNDMVVSDPFHFFPSLVFALAATWCYFHLQLCLSSQDHVSSNHFAKREPTGREAAGMGKKDTGKLTKKPGMLFCTW